MMNIINASSDAFEDMIVSLTKQLFVYFIHCHFRQGLM